MMKTLLSVFIAMLVAVSVIGQVVLYSTDFGTTATAAGTLSGGWVVSGTNSTNFSINTSSGSTGYSSPFSPSGSANLSEGVTGLAVGTSYLTLGGQINTLNVTSIQVSFAYRASSAGYPVSITLQWSNDNGSNWTNVSIGALTFDGNWRTINSGNWINLETTTENVSDLQFRFAFVRSASTGQNFRIDDFYVRGIVPGGTQPTHFFRSRASGDWNLSSTWESSSDNNTWVNSTLVPSSSSNLISIRNGHTVTVNNSASADQLTIESGGVLNHASSAVFSLNDNPSGVDMIINGTYVMNGKKPAGAGTCVVNNGGIVKANDNTGGESDDFAFDSNTKVTFSTGSVFEWNTSFFGASGITYFPNTSEKPIFRITSNAGVVGGGGATIINGLLEVNGSVTWDDAGTKTFRDGITGSGTITQSSTSGALIIGGSTSATLGGTGTINLSNAGLQIASAARVLLTGNKPVNNSNFINYGILECQTFAITGTTTFTNAGLASLIIGSPQGIAASGATGNIQTTGRVFNSNASYTYNSNVAQITGTGLPLTVSNLSISSTDLMGSNTITLTNNNTTVTNAFNLNNGFFAAGTSGNLQIAGGGTIFGTGGHNPNDASAGNIVFLGSGSTTGTLTGYPRLYSVIINGAVDFRGGAGESATILNKLQLNSGSSVSDAPYYQSGSSLVYSTGGNYNRNVEWGSAGSQGYPHHVTVQAGTIVNLNSNPISPAQLELGGDLIIGNANGRGEVYLNSSMNRPLYVKGNLVIGSNEAASAGSRLWLSIVSGGDLWLEGNFTRQANSFYDDNGRSLHLKGSTSASINTPGAVTPGVISQEFSQLRLEKTGLPAPVISLNCTVGINNEITFTGGVINTSTNNILVAKNGVVSFGGSTASFVNGPHRKIGNNAFTFHVGKIVGSEYQYRKIGISAPDNHNDVFTAEFQRANARLLGEPASPLQRVSQCEYWSLDHTNQGAETTVNVTLSWTEQSPCNVAYVTNLPTLAVAKLNGAVWNSLGNAATSGNTSNGTITSTDATNVVSNFFTLASIDVSQNPLPLSLSSFTARPRKTDIAIDWMLTNNNDYDEFILERSKDGLRFEPLKVVKAKVILNTAAYAEVDSSPFAGWNYYRLRAMNKTGRESISQIVKLWFGNQDVIRISPNPASEKILINFATPSSISQIELVNISGQVLQRIQTITFNTEINIAHLQAGMYVLRITGKNGLSTKSFIKQ